MKGRVLLLFPGRAGAPAPGLPVAPVVLAGVLNRRGFETEILDLRVRPLSPESLREPLCVGLSVSTGHQILAGLEAARRLRARFPRVPLVWGGVHPSMLPEQTLRHPLVDFVVHGEGEETLPELLDCLLRGAPPDTIAGLGFKDSSGAPRVNAARPFIDLDSLPLRPPYESLPLEKYPWQFFVQTGRGCPHACGYCYNTFYCRGRLRVKSLPRVLDEVEDLVRRFRLEEIGFDCDDAFFADPGRAGAVCEGLLARGLRVRWSAPARFDALLRGGPELLRLLVRSGCANLTFGGDSGSPRILELIGKNTAPETMLEAARVLSRETGGKIRADVNFIFGFPTETPADRAQTFALMDGLGKILPDVRFGVTLYTPYPGTPLYPLALRHGFRPPETFEGWGRHELGTFRAPWLCAREYRRLLTLSCMSRVDFFAPLSPVPARFSRLPARWLYRGLSALASLRWRGRFFDFPAEWTAVRSWVELRRGYF